MASTASASHTVYATNLLDPPSWYRISFTGAKEKLINLCYIETHTGHDESSQWIAYARFDTPISLELARQAFANKKGQPPVSVVACHYEFTNLLDYRQREPRWAHFSVEDFT